jgi:nucleoside-diphosphate-sugar epimerase
MAESFFLWRKDSLACILITGGAGNLGTALSQRLLQEGHRLRIFDLPQADFSFHEAWGTEIIKGSLLAFDTLLQAVTGMDIIFHLAAILPPASERDREHTFQVNVQGTDFLLRAMKELSHEVRLIFSSSVSVYGDTSKGSPPVKIDHPLKASDHYSESKICCEENIRMQAKKYTLLRISGIAIPAFMDPPEVWQFRPDQRIEMIAIADLVTALVKTMGTAEAQGKILNIAGGRGWQMCGKDFVEVFCRALDLPLARQRFQSRPGWFDWYDTAESQKILCYQKTSFETFEKQMRKAVEEAMA